MKHRMHKPLPPFLPVLLIAALVLLSSLLYCATQESYRAESFVFAFGVFFTFLIGFLAVRFLRLGDPYLIMIIFCLIIVSLNMLFRLDFQTALRQSLWFLGGLTCFFVTAVVFKFLPKPRRLWPLCLILSAALFAVTLLFGTERGGAKNWLYFFGDRFSVQPSEFVKLFFIYTLAALCSVQKKQTFFKKLLPTVVVYFHMGCLALQNEFGLAVLMFLLYVAISYVGGRDKLFLFLNSVLIAAAGLVGYRYIPHIATRVAVWQNPFSDPAIKGYQILQSMFAITAGGFMGVGMGNGSPLFIPEVSSDFIFSAICEEMGIMGGISLILLYFLLSYRGLKIALMVNKPFLKLLAVGVSACFAFQPFIIIGGVTKMIPMTGITLPFVSYGGSSLVSCFIAVGLLQGISARRGEMADELN